jgi:hypothetical protein
LRNAIQTIELKFAETATGAKKATTIGELNCRDLTEKMDGIRARTFGDHAS